jgi:hypothetical protein
LAERPRLDVALHVFHHDDGVIDHDADGQHEAEEAQRVDREAEEQHDAERADDRDRHRQQRDDGGAPGLQEDDDDDDDERMAMSSVSMTAWIEARTNWVGS